MVEQERIEEAYRQGEETFDRVSEQQRERVERELEEAERERDRED